VAVLAGVLLALCATPAAGAVGPCARSPAVGSHGTRFEGRLVLIHVPQGLRGGRHVPLVLAFHGAGGNGAEMERYSGFSHSADLDHFIAVYPTAVGPVWNITGSGRGANDVLFVQRLLDRLEGTLCVDSQRVYAAGVSNGGGMVALLGCALSARLAAIAPVAGIYTGQPSCRTARPVSVIEIHGTSDLIAPYMGPGASASSPGPPPFVRGWVHRDSCARTARTFSIASRSELFEWTGCAGGATVEHVRIQGGTHQWPGALPPDPGPASPFCGACEIWSFFSHVTLGGSPNGGVGLGA
jgi:polyhydroxybutyrate depolymerase